MTTQKKIAATLLTVVGAMAVLCNLLGIIGVWITASTLNSVTVATLSVVASSAHRSSQLLGEANDTLAQLETSMKNLNTRVSQVGANISENPVVLNALRQEYDERATPLMRQTIQKVRLAHTALDKAAATAEALDSNPFTARVTPDFTRLQTLDSAIDEILSDFIQLGVQLRDLKVDATQAVTGAVTSRIAKLDNSLKQAMDAVNALNQKATDLEARANTLQSSLPFWINMSALVATLVMLAALVAGVALAWTSSSYLRSNGQSVDTFLGHFRSPASNAGKPTA